MIYLLGIPLQVAVILWGALLKKPHKTKAKKNNLKQSNTGTKETINAEKSNLKFKREKKNNKKFAAQPTLIAEQNVENIPSSSSVAANENFSTLLGENANSNFGKIQPAEMNEKNMPIEINIETKTVETNQEFKAAEINKENKTAEIEKENQENKANKTNKVLDANKTNKKAKAKKNKDDDDFGFDFIKNKER